MGAARGGARDSGSDSDDEGKSGAFASRRGAEARGGGAKASSPGSDAEGAGASAAAGPAGADTDVHGAALAQLRGLCAEIEAQLGRGDALGVRPQVESVEKLLVNERRRRRELVDKAALRASAVQFASLLEAAWRASLAAAEVSQARGDKLLARAAVKVFQVASGEFELSLPAAASERAAPALAGVLRQFSRDRVVQREGLRTAVSLSCPGGTRAQLARLGALQLAVAALGCASVNDDHLTVEAALGVVSNLSYERAAWLPRAAAEPDEAKEKEAPTAAREGEEAPAGESKEAAPGEGKEADPQQQQRQQRQQQQPPESHDHDHDHAWVVDSLVRAMEAYPVAVSVQERALQALANCVDASAGPRRWGKEALADAVLASMRAFPAKESLQRYGLMALVNSLRAARAEGPQLRKYLFERGCLLTVKQAVWTFDTDETISLWSKEAYILLEP